MAVYWDGYGIGQGGGGIFQVAKHLARELRALGVTPTLIHSSTDKVRVDSDLPCFELSELPCLSKITRSKLVWPARVGRFLRQHELHRTASDHEDARPVFHGLSNFNVPADAWVFKSFRTLLSVYDLIPFMVPEQVSRTLVLQLKWLLPKVLPRVETIICCSKWTKESMLEFFPSIDPKRIVVVPLGLPTMPSTEVMTTDHEAPHNSIRLLTVGRHERYKRLSLAVDILRQGRDRFVLTVVTNQEGVKQLSAAHQDLIASGRLMLKHDLSDEDLAHTYRSNDLYIHPSLYEGFGFPPCEALSHGLPVLYQKGSALDELLGPGIGSAMSLSDSIPRWTEAAEAWGNIKREQCPSFLRSRKETMLTWYDWRQTALRYVDLYGVVV